jgi:hypothetical protein
MEVNEMETKSKFKINLKTGEIEIEGSEEFVSKQIDNLSSLTSLLSTSNLSSTENDSEGELSDILEKEDINVSKGNSEDLSVPDSYGEWAHKFKKNIAETDKTLVAGYYVQRKSSSNDFKTSEVNKILKDNGVKLSNPSLFIKGLANSKYVFQTRKEGKLNFMRVSKNGLEYLSTLLE